MVTRRLLSSKIGIPKSWFYNSKIQNKAISSIINSLSYTGNNANINLNHHSSSDQLPDFDQLKKFCLDLGKKGLYNLASLRPTHEGPFWFGSQITKIDCILYGVLAPLRGQVFPANSNSDSIVEELNKYEHLRKYIDLVHETLFSEFESFVGLKNLDYDEIRGMREINRNVKRVVQAGIGLGALYLFIPSLMTMVRGRN